MLVEARYKVEICKRIAALLEYWLLQQTKQQQCVNIQVQCAAISFLSDLQQIHTLKVELTVSVNTSLL